MSKSNLPIEGVETSLYDIMKRMHPSVIQRVLIDYQCNQIETAIIQGTKLPDWPSWALKLCEDQRG